MTTFGQYEDVGTKCAQYQETEEESHEKDLQRSEVGQ